MVDGRKEEEICWINWPMIQGWNYTGVITARWEVAIATKNAFFQHF